MSPGLLEDFRSEARLTGRVALALGFFYAIQFLTPSIQGSWSAIVFVAELTLAILLQWVAFTLVSIRPSLDIKWHFRDGRPIDSDHLTLEWSTTEPAKFYELTITYAESGLLARAMGRWISSNCTDTLLQLTPPMATVIVEEGRGLITASADGAGIVVPVPGSRPSFFANPVISINPKTGSAPTVVHVRSQPLNLGNGRPLTRLLNVRSSVQSIELVFDNGGP